MAKILSIVILVLVVVLFPPAALALVSNNAVPGDATYPIKRGLENIIYAVASLNPNTKAMFAKARSDRRFQEITVLLTQGKQTKQTLNELVEQTQTAADQINQVSNPNDKKQLIKQLSDSIVKYDQGLSKVPRTKPKISVPVPSVSPLVTLSTAVPKPVVTPGPTTTPAPNPPNTEIDKTLEELERIRRELELQRQELMKMQNQNSNINQNPVQTPSPKPTAKPTPSPTPTPIPTPSSTPSPRSTSNPAGIQTLDEGMVNQAADGTIESFTTTVLENISSDSSQPTE